MKYAARHNGFTSFRKSDRTYTHAVLVRCSMVEALANSEAAFRRLRAEAEADLVKRQAELETGTFVRYDFDREGVALQRAQDYLASSQREVARTDLEARIAKAAASIRAEVAKGLGVKPAAIPADFDVFYAAATWCGRPDLAAKEAAKRPGSVVVAVEVVA